MVDLVYVLKITSFIQDNKSHGKPKRVSNKKNTDIKICYNFRDVSLVQSMEIPYYKTRRILYGLVPCVNLQFIFQERSIPTDS